MEEQTDKFKIGSIYKYEMVMPDIDEMMGDILEATTGSREDVLMIEGPVVYNDGTTAIIKVKNMNAELDCYILRYDDVCERFKDFAAIEKESSPMQEYFCIDIENEVSRFFRDWDTWQIHNAVFDEDGQFLGYDYEGEDSENIFTNLKDALPPEAYERLEKIHKLFTSADVVDFHDKPPVKVSLSINASFKLKKAGMLEQVEDESVMCQGFNRAYKWLTTCNCAIVSAWRKDKTRAVNDKNNRALQRTLRDKGYGVYKVQGYYTGVDDEVGRENSFLVFDPSNVKNLRNDVYELSEKYEQDCFIYSEKGDTPTILVGTNDKFGKGRCEVLGRLEIDNPYSENYTEIGSGIISFTR